MHNLFRNTLIMAAAMLLAAFAQAADAQTTVTDCTDGAPIAGAAVYDKGTGLLMGVTGIDGKLPACAPQAKALVLQHIGYATTEKDLSAISGDTIAMAPISHSLSGVTIENASSDFLRLRAFVRQYNVVDGTPAYFRAGFYDFFVPTKHGATKVVGLKGGEWENRSLTDSIAAKSSMLAMALQLQAPSVSRNTAYSNYTKRYGVAAAGGLAEITNAKGRHIGMLRRNAADKTEEISIDSCAAEGKTINLFGFKITMYSGILCERYDTGTAPPCLGNMLTSYMCMGLYFPKHDVACDCFTEIYVISTSTASKQDLKDERNGNVDLTTLDKPEGVPPLTGALAQAVEKMQRIGRNK